jgi:uncharacterized protein (DUF39 family)
MGRLLPQVGNVTYSGAGELSPINNDPQFLTIGLGTRIFWAGTSLLSAQAVSTVRNPFFTLMVKGDLKTMRPVFLRGAYVDGYGCTLSSGWHSDSVIKRRIARAVAVTGR